MGTETHGLTAAELRAAETYFDAAPRADAVAHPVGPFTLFVSTTPFGYYARPRRDAGPIGAGAVHQLVLACAEHNVTAEVEWIHELHPALAQTLQAAGFATRAHALMTADPRDVVPPGESGPRVRVVEDEEAVRTARAVTGVAFSHGGTGVGRAGADECDKARADVGADEIQHLLDRAGRGLTVTLAAEDATGMVAVGSYQPVNGLAEIVAVATLPAARRQGLADLVTRHLVRHAWDHGVTGLLLSAQDESVARVYARVGFRRVGTAMAAVLERGPAGEDA